MRRSLSLDGDWERRDFLDEAWRWSDALRRDDGAGKQGPPAQASVSSGWRPARVPGSAIDDAWRAGEIPNPYVDRNSLAAEWIPQRTWLYRRRFAVPADAPRRAALRFEGIDPGGIVLVDGEEVASHAGMFVPLEIDLGDRLTPGSSHDLVVVVDPAPPMPSQVGRTELARHHRSRMAYGWDFCPRMIHTGIWRSVSVELRERAWLGRPVPDVAVDAGGRSGTVHVTLPVGGDAAGVRIAARVVDLADAREVGAATAPVRDGDGSVAIEVRAPRLWSPNGSGAPAMHRLEVRLEDGTSVLDSWSARIGFRDVELRSNAGAPQDARRYTLSVNGRATWMRGWNWVPLDACYGVPRPDRLGRLIELARRANVNLLRVWGGGLIESEAFYDACDEAGIMVWQEFAQSSSGVSNTPAVDDAFVDLMRHEAEAILPLRAHHPSLVIWGGGNELTDEGGHPLDERHPVLAVLHDEVAHGDPGRAWLPTSPSGPRFENALQAAISDPDSLHDVHGPWEHQGLAEQHAVADATTSLLHSEFGVEGMTNTATLRATVTEPSRWTADRTDPVMAHRGAWWNNRRFVERVFGGDLSLDELTRASQHLQADGLRTLVEGDRRRWPRNSGSLPWVFNEPFPNAWSNAAVDYFGVPKAAYFAVAQAYAPVLAGLSFASQVLDGATELRVTPWAVNDTDRRLSAPMEIALHDASGRRLASDSVELDLPANAVATGPQVTLPVGTTSTDLLVLDAAFAASTSRRLLSRTDNLEPMRRLPPADLGVAVEPIGDGGRWRVRMQNSAAVAVVEVRLDDARAVGWPERIGAAYVDAGAVTLLPGETRDVSVDWRDVVADERALRLSAWNTPEQVVTVG